VLTLAWQAGLHVVVPDIGAPAERVRQHCGGLVVPINLPPNRLVELFRDPAPFRPTPSLPTHRPSERSDNAP
jgi:hypothetical protein